MRDTIWLVGPLRYDVNVGRFRSGLAEVRTQSQLLAEYGEVAATVREGQLLGHRRKGIGAVPFSITPIEGDRAAWSVLVKIPTEEIVDCVEILKGPDNLRGVVP